MTMKRCIAIKQWLTSVEAGDAVTVSGEQAEPSTPILNVRDAGHRVEVALDRQAGLGLPPAHLTLTKNLV